MTTKSKQVNVRMDDDILALIEEMRASQRPIPSVSEVIRVAVLRDGQARGFKSAEKLLKGDGQ